MSFSLAAFRPHLVRVSLAESVRSATGALLGILLTGAITKAALGSGSAVPMLIAPMGASAVLLFAAPSSPLAQPWSIIGGNILAGLVGVTVAGLVADPILAAALALGLAIAAMLAAQCLHPPGGAVALTAVLGGPAVLDAGYGFVVWPVGVNSLVLLVTAIAFNRLAGKPYPAPARAPTSAPQGSGLLDVQPADIETVLRQYDEIVNVSPETLDALLNQAQIRAFQRKAGHVTCAAIMLPVTVTVRPHTPLRAVWALMGRNGLRAVPVVADDGTLAGIISRTDFFAANVIDRDARVMGWRIGRPGLRARDIMTGNVQSALPQTPIAKLVPPMVDQGLHQIPVVNAHNRVVGIVTQTALIGGLFRHNDSEGEAAA